MRTHADDVLEQVVLLVRALTRTGTYDPAHPNYERARTRLHRELVRLLRMNPEIAFVPTPPSVQGAPAELHIDGTSPSRSDIRRLIPENMGGAFALQLLEFLQQRGIVQLAFRKALALDEFIAFLDLAGTTAEGTAMDDALIKKGVRNVVVVTARDLPSEDLPWIARSALGRILHDAAAQLRRGGWGKVDKNTRGEIVLDAIRPFLRTPDALAMIMAYAPRIQARLWKDPALQGSDPRGLIMNSLPGGTVYMLVTALRRQAMPIAIEDSLRDELLQATAERLVLEPASTQRDRVLRDLCGSGAIAIDRLPAELREWIFAEQWVEAACKDPNTPPYMSSGIISKAVMHAVETEHYTVARIALRHLTALDPVAASTALDPATVETLAGRIPNEQPGRSELVTLFSEAGDTALFTLAGVIAAMETASAGPAAKLLIELGPRGGGAARKMLDAGVKSEAGTTALLAVFAPYVEPGAAPMLIKYTRHRSPAVRLEALSLLAAADPDKAVDCIAKALRDPDASVRVRALTICSSTGIGIDQIVPRAMDLILKDAASADVAVVCAAIDVVSRAAQQGALLTAQAEETFCQLVAPVGLLGRMAGHKPLPHDILLAGVSALMTFSSPKADRMLEKLARDNNPEIGRTVREARAKRSTQSAQR